MRKQLKTLTALMVVLSLSFVIVPKVPVSGSQPQIGTIYATASPPEGGTFLYGKSGQNSVEAVPNYGWVFSHWEQNGQTFFHGVTSLTYSPSFTEPIYVTAVFQQTSPPMEYDSVRTATRYTITPVASPGIGGVVSGGGTYGLASAIGSNGIPFLNFYLDPFTLSAVPASGYTFEGWYIDGKKLSAMATATFRFADVDGYYFGSAEYEANADRVINGYYLGNPYQLAGNLQIEARFKQTSTTSGAAKTKYAVTPVASPSVGGTVSGSGYYLGGEYGATVEAPFALKATPRTGYAFEGWYFDGKLLSAKQAVNLIYNLSDGDYIVSDEYADYGERISHGISITVRRANIQIEARFKQIAATPTPKPLNSVVPATPTPMPLDGVVSAPSSWAASSIEDALSLGLATDELRANYQGTTTRAEFCRAAVNFLRTDGYGVDSVTPKMFADTNDRDIGIAATLGITSGTDAAKNLFSPNGALTREQAATMLRNVMTVIGVKYSTGAVKWTDAKDVSSWAKEAVDVMYNSKIMSGTSSTALVFSPKTPYTHEQSIATLVNMWGYLRK